MSIYRYVLFLVPSALSSFLVACSAGNPVLTLYGYGGRWNADETRILTGGPSVQVWDGTSGKELLTLGTGGNARWNADETRILTWSLGEASVWDATSGEKILDLSIPDSESGVCITEAMWNSDETFIMAWSDLCNRLYVWNGISGERLFSWSETEPGRTIGGALWNPSGNSIISLSGFSLVGDCTGLCLYPFHVWDATTGNEIFGIASGAAVGALWSNDGTRILFWSAGGLQVWRVNAAGRLPTTLLQLPSEQPVIGAQWSADESRVLSWTENEVKVWDTVSVEETLTLSTFSSTILDGAMWNEDESRILYWEADISGYVTKVDADTGNWLGNIAGGYDIQDVALSPDGSLLLTWPSRASVQQVIRVWDAHTGEELFSFTPGGYVVDAIWNASGDRILSEAWSESGGSYVQVWDVTINR